MKECIVHKVTNKSALLRVQDRRLVPTGKRDFATGLSPPRRGLNQPLLVSAPTSSGSQRDQYWFILVTSTGSFTDQYWLVSLS